MIRPFLVFCLLYMAGILLFFAMILHGLLEPLTRLIP